MSAQRYNWEAIKTRYVTGTEDLRTIGNDPDTPAPATIMRRSAKEDWPGQRSAYRQQVASRTRSTVATEAAEVAARHVRIAKGMQAKALAALQRLDVDTLTPYQTMRLLQLGTDIERKALGLDPSSADPVELGELTLDELRRIAAGEEPSRVVASR